MPPELPPFEVECDARYNLLILRLRGFWQVGTVEAYIDAVNQAAGRLPALGRHGSLIDLMQFSVQARDVLGMMVAYARSEPRPARIAWIGGTALQRMQLRRTLDEMGGKLFDNYGDAHRWIIADTAPTTPSHPANLT